MAIPIHGYHRFFFFVPETLNPIFLENTKRRAPENDRDLSYQKLIWSHMMPFGVNSDPSFRAQKRRIRVRGSSFRTAGTVCSCLLHTATFKKLVSGF